jgi:5'(3')-deoxyribonucleotidase
MTNPNAMLDCDDMDRATDAAIKEIQRKMSGIIFVDMDGVLVDFMRGVHEFYNLPYDPYPYPLGEWDFVKHTGMSDPEFWCGLTATFWANLHWTQDGMRILKIIEDIFPRENICLLSSPTLESSSAAGKMEWIKRFLPEYRRRIFIGTPKHLCASHRTCLVDDADHNINAFTKAGGFAVRVPRPWNGGHDAASGGAYFLTHFKLALLGFNQFVQTGLHAHD